MEVFRNQKRVNLLSSCGYALEFYQGVHKAIVSDNLESTVNRAIKYEANKNRSFKDFAQKYNYVINSARGYSPQDKTLLENAVHIAYQRICYPLLEMIFL